MILRALVLFVLLPAVAAAQPPSPSPAPRQTDADEYTRYELLGPGTGQLPDLL